LVQPGDGAFDDPPGLAWIAAVCGSASGNLVLYAALRQRHPVGTTIVGAVGLDRAGLFQRASVLCSNRLNAIDQWQQLRDVMPVGLGQKDMDRDALRTARLGSQPSKRRSRVFGANGK
jgi:hypothetical protein